MRSDQFQIADIAVDTLSLTDAATRVCDETRSGPSFCVYTLNLDHIAKMRVNSAFQAAYKRARIILPDGFPIALAGRLQGKSVSRVTGSDFIEPLCAEASRRGIPVAMFGSTLPCLTLAARRLQAQHERLIIAGAYAPSKAFDLGSPEADAAVAYIRDCGAKIFFVALGAPKQELFAERCARETDGASFICIGAGLDFLAGTQKRAPKLFQKVGAEWLWRMVRDPLRLAPRYYDCVRVLPSVLFGASLRW